MVDNLFQPGGDGNRGGPVLIVEDEELVAHSIARILTKAGYRTQWARNLRTACHLSQMFRMMGTILDLNLDDSHGLDTITRGKGILPEPIVVFTGEVDIDGQLAKAAIARGAMQWVSKASTPETVLRILKMAFIKEEVLNIASGGFRFK